MNGRDKGTVIALAGILCVMLLAPGCAFFEKKEASHQPRPSTESWGSPATSPMPSTVPSPSVPQPVTPHDTGPSASTRQFFVHQVRWEGETVSIIALWYTGDLQNWKVLSAVNPNLNPSLIYVGDKILIPQDLMKTKEPMPKEFVRDFLPKPKKEPPPEPENEPQLFGPKGGRTK